MISATDFSLGFTLPLGIADFKPWLPLSSFSPPGLGVGPSRRRAAHRVPRSRSSIRTFPGHEAVVVGTFAVGEGVVLPADLRETPDVKLIAGTAPGLQQLLEILVVVEHQALRGARTAVEPVFDDDGADLIQRLADGLQFLRVRDLVPLARPLVRLGADVDSHIGLS